MAVSENTSPETRPCWKSTRLCGTPRLKQKWYPTKTCPCLVYASHHTAVCYSNTPMCDPKPLPFASQFISESLGQLPWSCVGLAHTKLTYFKSSWTHSNLSYNSFLACSFQMPSINNVKAFFILLALALVIGPRRMCKGSLLEPSYCATFSSICL